MRLPEINNCKNSVSTISEFIGLQKNKSKISEKNFESCMNMSHHFYPAAGSCSRRIIVGEIKNLLGMYASADKLYYVAKDDEDMVHLYCNGKIVCKSGTEIVTELSSEKKQMVMMGAYLIIWPDKIAFNTYDKSYKKLSFEQQWIIYNTENPPYEYETYMCNSDGIKLEHTSLTENDVNTGLSLGAGAYYTELQNVAKLLAEKGEKRIYYIQKKDDDYYLKYYNSSSKMWVTEECYCAILIKSSIADLEEHIKDSYDLLKTYIGNYVSVDLNIAGESELDDLFSGSKKLIDLKVTNGGYFLTYIFGGINIWKYTLPNQINVNQRYNILHEHYSTLTLSNKVPEMDFIVCAQNRLWGCSSDKHEIYASKLGEPDNFISFLGISSDSYTATVGSSGDFTGACVYNDYPVFFKEDRIITWYGTRPSNYQLDEKECDGIKQGCHKSVAYIDDYIYYLSTRGVMRYDGDYPSCISNNLGDAKFFKGIAAGANGIYYLAVIDNKDINHLYKYEIATGIWLEDDNKPVSNIVALKNNIYVVIDEKLLFVAGQSEPQLFEDFIVNENKDIEWNFITGDLIQGITNKSVVSSFYVSFELSKGAEVEAFVQYDNERNWSQIIHKKSNERQTFKIRVMPRRCEKIKLKFKGKGDFVLYQITRISKKAGDM